MIIVHSKVLVLHKKTINNWEIGKLNHAVKHLCKRPCHMQFERNGLRKVMEVCFTQNPNRDNNTKSLW